MSRERTTFITSLSLAALLSISAATDSFAVPLKAVSASINPIGGFPIWIQDQNSMSLQACLEPANCVLPVAGEEPQYNPNLPLSWPPATLNFPAEHFYFFAESNVTVTPNASTALVRLVVEAAYLPSIADGNQNFFHRFRVRLSDPPEVGVYTLLHPWGSTTFTGQDCTPGAVCTMTADVNVGTPQTIPPFVGILGNDPAGSIYTFLTQTTPTPLTGYLGDPTIAAPVTGSPLAIPRNEVQIIAPSGATIGSSNLFAIAGKKIGLDVNPSPAAPTVTTLVGTPVNIQLVTITNITGAPVAFNNPGAIALTGPDVTDFTIVTDSCTGQTLPIPDPAAIPPVTGACSLQVSFSPAATNVATRTAVVTITPDDTATAPPAAVQLVGIAQYQITQTATTSTTPTGSRVAGTIAPSATQNVNAGGGISYTLTPETGYFPRVMVDGIYTPITNNTVSFSNLSANRTFDVKFVRNGDLVEDGSISFNDALRGLQVALGLGTATPDERIAGDVGPLVSSLPKADGSVDVSDVMLILRRSLGVDPLW